MILGARAPVRAQKNEFAVLGFHAMLFDDDTAAAFISSSDALVPWIGDPEALMDRYDVRHLLEDLSALKPPQQSSSSKEDVSEEELDKERYKDLWAEDEEPKEDSKQDEPSKSREETSPDRKPSSYKNVAFNYGAEQNSAASSAPPSEEPFVPTFAVPEHLQSHLPATQKLHQIISGTAKFVSKHGGQAEIVLRVKQADNPTFGFLMPDHNLNPYFRYLVDNPALTGALEKPVTATVSVPSSDAGDSLKLLGQAYSDSEEDEERPGKLPMVKVRDPPSIAPYKEPPLQLQTVISKMVEFISLNGKEFEDVVKERDKVEGKFQFLLPWNEYYPYYLKMLQQANQELRRTKPSTSNSSRSITKRSLPVRAKSRFDSTPSMVVASLQPRKDWRTDEESDSDHSDELELELEVSKEEGSNDQDAKQEQSGMSFDAAFAAVMAATRGKSSLAISTGLRKTEEDENIRQAKAERLRKARLLTEAVKDREGRSSKEQGDEFSYRGKEAGSSDKERRKELERKRDRKIHGSEDDEEEPARRKERRRHSSGDGTKDEKSRQKLDSYSEQPRRRSRHGRDEGGGSRRRKRDRSEPGNDGDEMIHSEAASEIPDDLRAKVRAMLAEI